MARKDILEQAIAFTIRRYKKVGRRRAELPIEMETVLLVHSAQGIIDNGGLQFFFESNFEEVTPYCDICKAYHRIGAKAAATRIERAVAMFPFPDSHLAAEKRVAIMEKLWAEEESEFAELDFRLCGDENVWRRLRRYVDQNRAVFERA